MSANDWLGISHALGALAMTLVYLVGGGLGALTLAAMLAFFGGGYARRAREERKS